MSLTFLPPTATATEPPPPGVYTNPADPSQWDSWVDALGERYVVGDWIAYAANSGRLSIGIVERINRLYPSGQKEIVWHTRDRGDRQMLDAYRSHDYRDQQGKQAALAAWEATCKDSWKPACTILLAPHTYDCVPEKLGNRRTVKWFGAVLKIPAP